MDDLDGDSSVNEPSALSKKFAAIGHVRREMSATNVCVPAVFCLAYQHSLYCRALVLIQIAISNVLVYSKFIPHVLEYYQSVVTTYKNFYYTNDMLAQHQFILITFLLIEITQLHIQIIILWFSLKYGMYNIKMI